MKPFSRLLALALCMLVVAGHGTIAKAEGHYFRNDNLLALGALMELDFGGWGSEGTFVQRTVYRPAITFDRTFAFRAGGCIDAPRNLWCKRERQWVLGGEASWSRQERSLGGDDARVDLTNLWFGPYLARRTNYGHFTVEWIRVRASAGGARTKFHDFVAGKSDDEWRPRLELSAMSGLRLWSWLLLQVGGSYAGQPSPKPDVLGRVQQGWSALIRVGIEIRFHSRESSEPSKEEVVY